MTCLTSFGPTVDRLSSFCLRLSVVVNFDIKHVLNIDKAMHGTSFNITL